MSKILIIESNLRTKKALDECLKTKSFETIEAKNSAAGIFKAQKHIPDLIICDMELHKSSGFEVLKSLQKIPATVIIPFIFITSKNTESEFRQAMVLGANDCLSVPFTPIELSEAISTQLKKRSLLEQWYPFQFQPVSSPAIAETGKSKVRNSGFNSCSQLNGVFDFIEAHYHEGISLQDVAKGVGFSSTYLTELVKRQTGKTVNRWIIERRLTAACSLLLETTNSIESIAESVGYNNLTHFFSQFRKHYQTTPKVWRQTYRY